MIILEGETLGQKHQHYNKLLKETTSINAVEGIEKINYNEPDIDNIFKIDIASYTKDVDYILEVFKCEDMLYVSRALKQSVWLITDIRYANIINPDYIHSQLLPRMTSKAGHKLMSSIRLNLKDENRVELFHLYYEDKKEFKTALTWLPNCSVPYIEKAVKKHISDIPLTLVKRLCEKSITILETYVQNQVYYNVKSLLSTTTFLLTVDAEKFISIVNSQNIDAIPRFSPKATKIMMHTRPDIILDNFEKFAKKVNIPTFVTCLKKDEIKDFLLKHINNSNLKSWFTFETMKYFIYRMPSDGRFDFVKRICIGMKIRDYPEETIPYDDDSHDMALLYSPQSIPQSSNANIYKWYKFAPFSVAFPDLKKLIRVESNPSERNQIFAVLIACAKQNSQNLLTVLQYYRDKHINEPFKFKSHFVNIILSQLKSHKLDDKCWAILNEIFCSMEVYNVNENNVQTCLKHILIYKILHDTKVPDIVQEKFEFDTLKSFQSRLDDQENNKVFNYLYQFIMEKIKNVTVNSEADLNTIITHIINVLKLLTDWKKNLLHYPNILEKIREVIKINSDNAWNEDLSGIYNVNKTWRKHMFQESLFLQPNQETYINALKHGPEMLWQAKDSILSNDDQVLTRLLGKVRIYWPQTIAKALEDAFRNQLNCKANHKMSVQGLCSLLPQDQLIDILTKYTPSEMKIIWAETEDSTFNIQKCFAKYMHLARPHPPVELILLYAKGDYLQFVLPSVHSILFNISSERCIKYIPTLLDTPVSFQKHGLKIAFNKLKVDELLLTSLKTWDSTKNSSIRATIFKLVFDLLCKETNENNINEIWHVLEKFIDNLTCDENKIVYVTLGHVERVPLPVKQAYCMKSYRLLKSLPPKTNCGEIAESVICKTIDVMETMDVDFIVDVILESYDTKFTKDYNKFTGVISAYLLSTKCEATQKKRYELIFVPLLQKYLTFLESTDNKFFVKYNFNTILKEILEGVENITIEKNMITPITLFTDIYNDLEKRLSYEDNYVLIMTWKLAAIYMQIINKHRDNFTEISAKDQKSNESNNSKWIKMCSDTLPDFTKVCIELLREEIRKHFPSVYMLFCNALDEIFKRFSIFDDTNLLLTALKMIQNHADIIEGHLLVLKLLPTYIRDKEAKEERSKICKALGSHQSAEVRMHYQQMLRENELYHELSEF